MYGRANGNCRKAQSFYKKSFLKGDVLVKMPVVRSIADLGKKDLSYLIQLIEDETETLRTPAIKEKVIRRITENPRLTTRQVVLENQKVCSSSVWKILH